jgi:hypothetical protein
MIVHRGLTNYLSWCTRAYAADAAGGPVQSSISFDLTVTSLFAPLCAGDASTCSPRSRGRGAGRSPATRGRLQPGQDHPGPPPAPRPAARPARGRRSDPGLRRRRRAVDRRAPGLLARERARDARDQRVRPDGDGRRLLRLPRAARRADARRRPDRPPDRQYAAVRARRPPAAGPAGRPRRALRRRRRPGARLPGAPRTDGRAVRARPLRSAGGAAVPHRRPGAVARRRAAGVPGSGRPTR